MPTDFKDKQDAKNYVERLIEQSEGAVKTAYESLLGSIDTIYKKGKTLITNDDGKIDFTPLRGILGNTLDGAIKTLTDAGKAVEEALPAAGATLGGNMWGIIGALVAGAASLFSGSGILTALLFAVMAFAAGNLLGDKEGGFLGGLFNPKPAVTPPAPVKDGAGEGKDAGKNEPQPLLLEKDGKVLDGFEKKTVDGKDTYVPTYGDAAKEMRIVSFVLDEKNERIPIVMIGRVSDDRKGFVVRAVQDGNKEIALTEQVIIPTAANGGLDGNPDHMKHVLSKLPQPQAAAAAKPEETKKDAPAADADKDKQAAEQTKKVRDNVLVYIDKLQVDYSDFLKGNPAQQIKRHSGLDDALVTLRKATEGLVDDKGTVANKEAFDNAMNAVVSKAEEISKRAINDATPNSTTTETTADKATAMKILEDVKTLRDGVNKQLTGATPDAKPPKVEPPKPADINTPATPTASQPASTPTVQYKIKLSNPDALQETLYLNRDFQPVASEKEAAMVLVGDRNMTNTALTPTRIAVRKPDGTFAKEENGKLAMEEVSSQKKFRIKGNTIDMEAVKHKELAEELYTPVNAKQVEAAKIAEKEAAEKLAADAKKETLRLALEKQNKIEARARELRSKGGEAEYYGKTPNVLDVHAGDKSHIVTFKYTTLNDQNDEVSMVVRGTVSERVDRGFLTSGYNTNLKMTEVYALNADGTLGKNLLPEPKIVRDVNVDENSNPNFSELVHNKDFKNTTKPLLPVTLTDDQRRALDVIGMLSPVGAMYAKSVTKSETR